MPRARWRTLAALATLTALVACSDDGPEPCGNGLLDPGELCDPMITSGAGVCPEICSSADACVQSSLVGEASACDRRCVEEPVSTCSSASDGCCPALCSAEDDVDCGTSCETVTGCSDGDGCCPGGCNFVNDSDCQAQCQAVTTCDASDGCCPGSCSAQIGPQYDADCELCDQVSECTNGDSCCPAGCSNANDSDCAARCAAVVACAQADGCCPSSCTAANDSDCRAAACGGVTECVAGDLCCPAGCAHPADPDCPASPPGGVGWPCGSADECTALDTAISCFPTELYPDGYCSQPCRTVSCPAGSQCSDGGWCIDECDPSSAGDCRPGYVCGMPRDSSFFGCVPAP